LYKWIETPFTTISDQIFHAVAEDSEGNTWLGGPHGLFRYRPGIPKNYNQSFNTNISAVRLMRDSISYSNISTDTTIKIIPYELNSITFSFYACFFERNDKLQFQYILEGFDKDWTKPSTETIATFTNLREGTYTFKTRAINIYNEYGSVSQFRFKILPPWQRTWYFYGGSFLLAILLVYSYTNVLTVNKKLNKQKKIIENQKEKLETSNRDLNDFANVVSHDLKAPLRGIGSLSEMLITDYSSKLDEKGKRLTEMMINRVERMQNLISSVLKYSKEGAEAQTIEDIKLNSLIEETVEFLSPPDHVEVIIQKDMPKLKMAKVQLTIILENLISNAIKYMDKESGRIEIGCVTEGTLLKFNVSDNGPGIDPKYHDKIFQIFQTLDKKSEYESTGIGLALAKKIVNNIGGKIWVDSKEGQGSTFYFTVPIEPKK
ncbi:MAG: GHKL domain-containing protein, partial [Bacteroidetes bacterium]|nr:GHKL domain-containing protein [Bacteroidota bacterium]